MNINAINAVRTFNLGNAKTLKQNFGKAKADSFEKDIKSQDSYVSYPQSSGNNLNIPRKKLLEVLKRKEAIRIADKKQKQAEIEKEEARRVEEKRQKQEAIRKEFYALYKQMIRIFNEISASTDAGMKNIYNLKNSKWCYGEETLKRNQYTNMCLTNAQKVEELMPKLEELHKKMEELESSGQLEFAEITDKDENGQILVLSPENLEFYKNLSYMLLDKIIQE